MKLLGVRKMLVGAGALAALAAPVAVTASSPAVAASSNTFKVTATEYTYKFSGTPTPGNVEIAFNNAGVELHMTVFFQLKPGVTAKQLETAITSDDQTAFPKIAVGDGQPVNSTPAVLSPKQSTTTIASFKAGHYGVVCFVPASDGKPHVMKGMSKVFDVSGSKSTLKPPTDGVVNVSISDTAITLPSSGLPKSGWVKVTNTASTNRDFTLAKLATGVTFDQADADFNTFFQTGSFPGGTAPATIPSGLSGLAPGTSGYVLVTTSSGNWAALSSNNESQDNSGQIHTEFTVK